jgi:hypothetical protein
MTAAQKFASAVAELERKSSGQEKFELMHSSGRAKATLLKKQFSLYAIPWDGDWFPDPPLRRRKKGAAT